MSWPKNEMPVVRHDAVRQEAYANCRFHLEQKLLRSDIVLCALEEPHSGGGTVDYVVDELADEVGASRHLVLP